MRYLFIVNPMAGMENPMDVYSDAIKSVCDANGIDGEFQLTERVGHATELARAAADAATEENPLRVFAVGGDGTLCEVANGVMGKPWCELGSIPCGSGNDFIKAFCDRSEFLKLEDYITSGSLKVDGIKSELMNSINICSLGLDANICDMTNRIKAKNRKLSNSKAYNKAVTRCLFGKLYNVLKITIDDTEVFEGKYMFSLAASGQFYGSGMKSAPMADPCDGLLDFVFVKAVSHLRAISLVGDYKTGEYFYKKKFEKIVIHRRGKKIRIEAKNPAIVNIDGETMPINDVTFEVVPSAFRFIVPKSVYQKHTEANKAE